MENSTYKTIDELKTEIQKRATQADLSFVMTTWLINATGMFMFVINVFILAVLMVVTIITEAYKDYRQVVIMVYGIFTALCILEINISSNIRKKLLSSFIDVKYDLAWQCFTEYENYENMEKSERIKFFENVIVGAAGLVKEK